MPSVMDMFRGFVAGSPLTGVSEEDVRQSNPSFELFDQSVNRKSKVLDRLSVATSSLNGGAVEGGIMINKGYHNFIYSQIDSDKFRRLQESRRIAVYAEVSNCLDEICDEVITYDTVKKSIINCEIQGDYNSNIKDAINAEFTKFIEMYDLENKGWKMVRKFLIEGELFWENIISVKEPYFGILGIRSIPSELINPIYDNTQNEIIDHFLLKKIIYNSNTPTHTSFSHSPLYQNATNVQRQELIPLSPSQVTYVCSDIWNDDMTIRLPFVELCKRAYKQLSLIEDSIVVYRLVRAPERLKFKIDVGTMNQAQAESYIKRQMQLYWTKKSLDGDGRITNSYDPQSMLDSYWFPKRTGQDGSDVEVMQGGQNLGQLEDLNYFLLKLYKSLKIPASRFAGDQQAADGAEITRDELRFAKFIMRIQSQLAMGIKNAFITHLKLRGKDNNKKLPSWWEEFGLREADIAIAFNPPSNFLALREQQQLEIKINNFTSLGSMENISASFAQANYLGWTEAQIRENRERLRLDAALNWEVQQIIANGPNFREILKQQADELSAGLDGGDGGLGAGGLGGGGGAGGAGGLPPEFGDLPGAEPAPEAEAPAEAPPEQETPPPANQQA